MTSHEKVDILSEFEIFLQELEYYRYSRFPIVAARLPRRQVVYIGNLRNKLLRDVGRFKFLIIELVRKEDIEISDKGSLYSSDMWIRGLRLEFDLTASEVLNYCIDITNVAIGKLQDDIRRGHRDTQGNPIEKPLTVDTEPPKAFIAHEGMTRSLDEVKSFLDALGIKHLIAEFESSDGRTED